MIGKINPGRRSEISYVSRIRRVEGQEEQEEDGGTFLGHRSHYPFCRPSLGTDEGQGYDQLDMVK